MPRVNSDQVNTIILTAFENGVDTDKFMNSKYFSMWLACDHYQKAISSKEKCEMQKALETLCSGKLTQEEGIQRILQESFGPEGQTCKRPQCNGNAEIPCGCCWDIFYCTMQCKDKDKNRHKKSKSE